MKKKKLISRLEFSRLAGVTPQAITAATKPGGRLAPAVSGRRIDAGHAAAFEYAAIHQARIAGGPDPLYQQAVEHCIDAGEFTIAGIMRRFDITRHRGKKIFDDMAAAGVVPPPSGQRAGRRPGRSPSKASRTPAPAAAAGELLDDEFEIPEHIEQFADMTLRQILTTYRTNTQFTDFLVWIKTLEIIKEKRLKNAEKEGVLVSRDLVEKNVVGPFNECHLKLLQDGAESITEAVIAKHSAGISRPRIKSHVTKLLGSFIAPVQKKIARGLRSLAP